MKDKLEVARALREIGMLLQVKGENPFKVRAYEIAARALEDLEGDLASLIATGRLRELRGVGEALERKIAELHTTGHTPALDRLRAELPPGILELMEVPELGPRKIAALHEALGIRSIPELRAACEAGRLRELKGFGEKTERKILEGIGRLETRERRVLLADALEVGERLVAHLRASPAVARADLAGSARRMKETVGDLDLVAASTDPAAVADHFLRFPRIAHVLSRGDTEVAAQLASGLQVDLRLVPPADYATLLHHLTGSKAHHVKLRGIARDRGLTLSEWGLARIEGGDRLPIAEERDLYAALGMQEVPPELREDTGEIEAARAGTLPQDLVQLDDLQGAVHCHTTYSDGRASLEEMARAADALGLRYLTITDHSPSASYAGGLTLDRLEAQWEEMARIQERVKVRLLRGTESDILEGGALDWPDRVLERFDIVIASVHSRHKMDEAQMTRRLVAAMRHPVFKIWGHALGRLLLEREPFACRVEEVLDAAAGSRAAVEVNGDPRRMELEPRYLRLARERGLRFVLSTDAHSTQALSFMRYAVATARRGWVRRGEVLNARPLEAFREAVRPAP